LIAAASTSSRRVEDIGFNFFQEDNFSAVCMRVFERARIVPSYTTQSNERAASEISASCAYNLVGRCVSVRRRRCSSRKKLFLDY
jgi:hypothetical protein